MATMQVYAYSCGVSDRASYRNVSFEEKLLFSSLRDTFQDKIFLINKIIMKTKYFFEEKFFLRDTFQDKRIPFPLRCTFAFLPYAPRKMLIQQLCNKDHVMRTILS